MISQPKPTNGGRTARGEARRARLCMVVHGPYPVGEPRVAREAAAALRAGYDVDVVAMRRRGEPLTERVGGARVFRLPLAHRRGARPLGVVAEYIGFTLLATFRVAWLSLVERYDVVQVHNPPDFLLFAALVPKLRGARVVFDVHDLSPDMFAMRFGGKRGAAVADRLLRVVERVAAALADAVITVHEPYRRELEGRGVPAEKTTVVMNTVDERVLPRRLPQPERNGFRVFYHGTVTPPYGVELIVEAAAVVARTIADVRVEIYGEGDALPGVRRRASELGISDRVAVTPSYVPQREVLEHAAGATVGVVPNLPTPLNRFALSSKLFEYVALGTPVVSADLPTIREHFSDDELLFFRAGDARALANALIEIGNDPERAAERAAAARRRYESYRWRTQEERYLAVLRGAVDNEGQT